jgi:hypothetical protein
MDSIAKSYLDSFIIKLGLGTSLSESTKFEHFCAYSLLSQEINSNLLKIDLEIISTGDSKGVDTIAFCINEKLILNDEEIDNFENQSFNVDVFFMQSKTTEGFNDAELGNFLDVIIDFFSDHPKYIIPEFENAKNIYIKLKSKISNIRDFNLHCWYISLGQEQNVQTTIDSTKEIKKQLLLNYSLFSTIDINLIDKSTLLSAHKKAITPLKATFKFENKIQLSGINNVEEAYIGFIQFLEFKNLIMDENQTKIKSLFNDNLRDFLGLDNPINQGIKKTLEDNKFSEFSLLNNGITVIADSNAGKGNTLVLENYQIVNGCQTSNVLFECRNMPSIDTVLIPLKVVITNDENLRDEIILTTNSQSKFTEDQLFAITQFQKTLEDYYKSNQEIDNLYYERRTNQFAASGISRDNVIEIREQLKSFMAIFFDLPHLVAGNVGKVVSNHKGNFFQKEHSPIPYYIAGSMSIKWDKFLQKNTFMKEFNKYRYHIFMGFRYIVEDLPFRSDYLKHTKSYSVKIDDNKRVNSYDNLLKSIRDDNIFLSVIKIAIDVFKYTDYNRAKGAYSNPITQDYIKLLQECNNATD